jgi:porin
VLGGGNKTGAAGDFDIFGKWSIFSSSSNDGYIGFAIENRHHLAPITPANLNKTIGLRWQTADGFNQQKLSLIQIWWEQYLFNHHFGFRVGKIDQYDFFDANDYESSNLYFVNEALSSNPAIAAPSNGLGAVIGIFIKKLYMLAGIGDTNAEKTSLNFSAFWKKQQYFRAIEFGYHNEIDQNWGNNYHVTLWSTDPQSKPDGTQKNQGFTLSMSQHFNNNIIYLLRYSHAYPPKNSKLIQNLVVSGIIFKNLFLIPHNLLGFGFGCGSFRNVKQPQYVAESFFRIQITPYTQITPDLQLILNPSNIKNRNTVFVFGLRARIAF